MSHLVRSRAAVDLYALAPALAGARDWREGSREGADRGQRSAGSWAPGPGKGGEPGPSRPS